MSLGDVVRRMRARVELPLGKCSALGCEEDAVMRWPMVKGNPAFCIEHRDIPLKALRNEKARKAEAETGVKMRSKLLEFD